MTERLETSEEFRERYELIRELGRGAMAFVWLAEQVALRRRVAVKFVRGSGDAVERMQREARILSGLTHPNLVNIFDSGREGDLLYLVLELVEGEPLQARLERESRLQERDAIDILVSVLKALEHIHSRGVLHRDVKPANILLPFEGEAKLSDFGLARWSERETTFQTREGVIPGSPAYMSPQLYQTGEATAESDLWAATITLFRSVAGRLPWTAEDLQQLMGQILHKDPFESGRFREAFSPEMAAFLMEAMSRDPARRPCDARSYIRALTELGGPGTVTAPSRDSGPVATVATTETVSRPRAASVVMRQAGLALAGAAAVLLGVLSFQSLRGLPAPGQLPIQAEGAGASVRPPVHASTIELGAVDPIVRDAEITLRISTRQPARLSVRYGPAGEPLSASMAETEATTRHLLRIRGLKPGSRYLYEVFETGERRVALSGGELETLTEEPYWTAGEYRPLPGELTWLGPNDRGHEEYRNELDGSVMILVPGKQFTMGDRAPDRLSRALPAHEVRVDSFLLDKLEVTRRQFRRFVEETGYDSVNFVVVRFDAWDERPMTNLSWANAAAYAAWAGKRLPTEAEWELAAGAGDGRLYPWGDAAPEREVNCDWRMEGSKRAHPLPVGSFPEFAGPFGHLDMAGGVREWCADWVSEGYYAASPFRNPQGAKVASSFAKVQRSGDYGIQWDREFKVWHRFTRHFMGSSSGGSGLRCARDL